MKKFIFSLLLAVTALVTNGQTILKRVVFNVPSVDITWDSTTTSKPGTYQLIFSDTAGIIYFTDSAEHSSMRIRVGKHLTDQGLSVFCNYDIVDATALAYDAVVNNEIDVTFVMVLLNDGAKLYAMAINLGNYTLSMRLDNSMLQYNK